jgi:hypothetical protein
VIHVELQVLAGTGMLLLCLAGVLGCLAGLLEERR